VRGARLGASAFAVVLTSALVFNTGVLSASAATDAPSQPGISQQAEAATTTTAAGHQHQAAATTAVLSARPKVIPNGNGPPPKLAIYLCRLYERELCANVEQTGRTFGPAVVTMFRSAHNLKKSALWTLQPHGYVRDLKGRGNFQKWIDQYGSLEIYYAHSVQTGGCLAFTVHLTLVVAPCGLYIWAWDPVGGAIWALIYSTHIGTTTPRVLTLSPDTHVQGWIAKYNSNMPATQDMIAVAGELVS
jgi:hypothetical protein